MSARAINSDKRPAFLNRRRWPFAVSLGLWWLFLYWERVSADKMFCMYRAASGGSSFYSCERPWDEVLWQAFLPLAVIGGVMLIKKAVAPGREQRR